MRAHIHDRSTPPTPDALPNLPCPRVDPSLTQKEQAVTRPSPEHNDPHQRPGRRVSGAALLQSRGRTRTYRVNGPFQGRNTQT